MRFQNQIPYSPINLGSLQAKYNKAIEFTTKGDFPNALLVFKSCLQSIPLMILTQKEGQLEKLVKDCTEYVTAMRLEIERKKLVSQGSENNLRMTELSCYMTFCGMENAHKFLAFKNAMNNNYKMNNFITASHFARLVLDLEPSGIF